MKKKRLLCLSALVLGLTGCGMVDQNSILQPSFQTSSETTTSSGELISSLSSESTTSETKITISNVTSETKTATSLVTSESTTTTSTKTSTTSVLPTVTETEMSILSYGGDQESIYATFNPIKDATGYNVYYKKAYSESWIKVDSELLRQYKSGDSYIYRVDVVGISAGIYDLKVNAVISGSEELKASVNNLTAIAYDRSGFAFSKASGSYGTGSGAYNDDGTLKNGAKVIYVDASNAKTVTATVDGKSYTGLQTIIDAKQKASSTEILDIRVIGEITKNDLDHISSSSEGLQIKGASNYQTMNLTLEGVGYDASFYGFGVLTRNAQNVEIRNLGFLYFMDDGVSMDSYNRNMWVHDNDFFYGQKGSDSDQAKGDGTTDLKADSQFMTISYNHYFDSGKSSLCGMKSESGPNYITYQHNWFDHSDSRHPRIRTMSVHVYNNYYDGNAKYGIGATTGACAFVEGNYFRNCKYPMLTSQQGSDIATDSKGTFSGENGGFIKAYNNTIIGGKGVVYYSEGSTDYDAYLASSRDEVISSSIVAKKGGATYNNFDTTIDLGVSAENVQSPEDAMVTVKKYAGRLDGGDVHFTFTEADDESYEINSELEAIVKNYKNENILSNLSNTSGTVTEPVTTTTGSETSVETTTTSSQTVVSGSSGFLYVSGKVVNADSIFTYSGTVKDKSIPTATYNGTDYTQALKLDSKGSISFTLTENAVVTIVISAKADGATIKINDETVTLTAAVETLTFNLEAGTYTIIKGATESYVYVVDIKEA